MLRSWYRHVVSFITGVICTRIFLKRYSGTSHAAALTAGVVALIKSFRAGSVPGSIGGGVENPWDFRQILFNYIAIQPDIAWDTKVKTGGMISAKKVLEYLKYYPGGPVPTADMNGMSVEMTDFNGGAQGVRGTINLDNVPDVYAFPEWQTSTMDIRWWDASHKPVEPVPNFKPFYLFYGGGALELEMDNSPIPDEARFLAFCPKSYMGLIGDAQYCKPVPVSEIDSGAPFYYPRTPSLKIEDDDSRSGIARVRLQFLASVPDEAGHSSYRVYQALDAGGQLLKRSGVLAEIKKIGYHSPTITGSHGHYISQIPGSKDGAWKFYRGEHLGVLLHDSAHF